MLPSFQARPLILAIRGGDGKSDIHNLPSARHSNENTTIIEIIRHGETGYVTLTAYMPLLHVGRDVSFREGDADVSIGWSRHIG
jgi:hypothetical protein